MTRSLDCQRKELAYNVRELNSAAIPDINGGGAVESGYISSSLESRDCPLDFRRTGRDLFAP